MLKPITIITFTATITIFEKHRKMGNVDRQTDGKNACFLLYDIVVYFSVKSSREKLKNPFVPCQEPEHVIAFNVLAETNLLHGT